MEKIKRPYPFSRNKLKNLKDPTFFQRNKLMKKDPPHPALCAEFYYWYTHGWSSHSFISIAKRKLSVT